MNYSTATASTSSDIIWYSYWGPTNATTFSTGSGTDGGWVHVNTSPGIWYRWSDNATTTYYMPAPAPAPETEEQQQARRAEQERRVAEYAAMQQVLITKKEAADKRATELLREHLNETQRSEFDKQQRFCVRAKSGVLYRLKMGWAGNVEALDDGDQTVLRRYCIHPNVNIPYADNLLCQKLLLETNEESFLQIANVTVVRQAAQPLVNRVLPAVAA